MLAGKSKIFLDLTLSDADLGPISARSAGWSMVRDHEPDSAVAAAPYGPMPEAMIRVCKKNPFTQRQGFEIMLTLCRGSKSRRAWRRMRLVVGGGRS